jgi:hypothetical protein
MVDGVHGIEQIGAANCFFDAPKAQGVGFWVAIPTGHVSR